MKKVHSITTRTTHPRFPVNLETSVGVRQVIPVKSATWQMNSRETIDSVPSAFDIQNNMLVISARATIASTENRKRLSCGDERLSCGGGDAPVFTQSSAISG